MIGTIKWYNIRKGYGIIQGKDGKEVFVHKSTIPFQALTYLYEGDKVEYLIGQSKQGSIATNLQIL